MHSTEIASRALRLYYRMTRIRKTEERIIRQYAEQNAEFKAGRTPAHAIRCPTHLSIGQEATAVAGCESLTNDDVVWSTHRCHGHYLAKGGDLNRMMAELFGRQGGCAKGKGGSMHLVDTSVGMMGSSAIVGGSLPLALGAALAFKKRGEPRVSVAFFGDGAVEEGTFHEAMELAGLWKLPVVLICENNQYATFSTLTARQVNSAWTRADSYGVVGVHTDGNNILQMSRVVESAVERARNSEGPTFIEADTYRWCAHVGTDPDTGLGARTQAELDTWKERCPIRRLVNQMSDDERAQLPVLDTQIDEEIENAVQFAHQSPAPTAEELFHDL